MEKRLEQRQTSSAVCRREKEKQLSGKVPYKFQYEFV
jgi:hypothetical protein